jgi:hypothetical protein
MSENIARNMQSSLGIINYPTQLHPVGHFRKLYHDARNHGYQTITSIERNVFRLHEVSKLSFDKAEGKSFLF